MDVNFKRVPAIDQCFSILELLSRGKEHLSISEIAKSLNLNKSTVFNIVYTLRDLNILNQNSNGFSFGTKLYVLGKSAEKGSELIRNLHPYLEEISRATSLSAFLGMRSGLKAIIVDKSDSSTDLKVSSEIGTQIPLVAGAHGKAFLSMLSEENVKELLDSTELKPFTPFSCLDKATYMEMIKEVKEQGFATDKEEYIEGLRAMAIPLNINRGHLQIAIWIVGLKSQLREEHINSYSKLLIDRAQRIESEFFF